MSPHPAGPGPSPVLRGTDAAALSQARSRLLEHVQARGEATVAEVARAFGQHPNTVREHLDALVAAGFLMRARSPGPGRGRPAWLYRVDPDQPEPDPRVREYGALAGALAAHIAEHSSDPHAEARQAGGGGPRPSSAPRRATPRTPRGAPMRGPPTGGWCGC